MVGEDDMVTKKQIESEAQYQNPAPIGPQSPIPGGVHDMIVSWDRNEGYMSVRLVGDRWWFKELLGKAIITETNNQVGRIHIQAKGQIQGEQLILWRPSDAEPHPMVRGERRLITHNRMCYFRAVEEWRWRDNRMPWDHPDALRVVKGYVGDWNIEWESSDTIAHLFHNGFGVLCAAGCCMHPGGGYGHFYEADRWEEYIA